MYDCSHTKLSGKKPKVKNQTVISARWFGLLL